VYPRRTRHGATAALLAVFLHELFEGFIGGNDHQQPPQAVAGVELGGAAPRPGAGETVGGGFEPRPPLGRAGARGPGAPGRPGGGSSAPRAVGGRPRRHPSGPQSSGRWSRGTTWDFLAGTKWGTSRNPCHCKPSSAYRHFFPARGTLSLPKGMYS